MPPDGWKMDDIFEEFERRFRRMQQFIDRAVRSTLEESGEHQPYIYGWTFRMGPDGTPRFSEFGNMNTLSGEPEAQREPLVDIVEDRDTISVTVKLPGVRKEDIGIEMRGTTLTITVNSGKWRYHKEVTLPGEVEEESAHAIYNNGVLDVEFRKRHTGTGGKRIPIS